LSVPDEGLEPFVLELRQRLFCAVPRGKRADLNAV